MANTHKILLNTARISGLFVTVFFLSFFIGEGLPDIMAGKARSFLYFLPYTLPAFTGFMIALFRPVTGGWVMVAGSLLLMSYFLLRNDLAMSLVYGLPSLLIGICFLASKSKELI